MGTFRWRPRASGVGQYLACEWRAANDRAIAEKRADPALLKDPERDTCHMSLGTCIHFETQDGLRCQFASQDMLWLNSDEDETEREQDFAEISDRFFGGDDDACVKAHLAGDPRTHAPKLREYEDASLLFGKNMSETRERIRASAKLAAQHVPASPDGKPWICETAHENEYVTGHSDFWSQDGTVLGDLKSTAKPPVHAYIKYEHYGQLAVYHNLTGCLRSWVLYVDSMRAAWTTLVWIDWTRPGPKRYAAHIAEVCRYLCSDQLYERAIPRLGPHCKDTWCPYYGNCHQDQMPPRGIHIDAVAATQATGPLLWGGKAIG
jgi:hypothetical protein